MFRSPRNMGVVVSLRLKRYLELIVSQGKLIELREGEEVQTGTVFLGLRRQQGLFPRRPQVYPKNYGGHKVLGEDNLVF